jgi:hydrogenase-4 component F
VSSLTALAAIPLFLALCGLFPRLARPLPPLAAVLMVAQIPVALRAAAPALSERAGASPSIEFGLDGIGAAFLVLTTVVAAAAAVQAACLYPAERRAGHGVSDARLCLYYTLASLFLLSMYGVLLARNLGYLWIAMEATTLMSAPLVYFHRSRASLEAAWKYLLLCSVGIAFALFGTVLIFAASQLSYDGSVFYDGSDQLRAYVASAGQAASRFAGGSHVARDVGAIVKNGGTLALGELIARGPDLDPRLLRLGFIFCLLGYGTKAGIFPLHNWLPDAHSEAPAPASAMLSGALLNCALVAVWRIGQVVAGAGQQALLQQMLVPAGAVTVLGASLMLVRQHDLKRMWAYSSVEHVGLLSLAIGIRSGPLFLLHAINHSLVKTTLFLLAGNLFYLFGTKSLGKLGGLLRTQPSWGVLLAAGTFAAAGSPPFGTFLSEWLLLSGTLAARETGAAVLVLVGLTITFVAVASHVARVLFGPAPALSIKPPSAAWSLVPATLLALSLLSGLAIAPSVMAALSAWTRGGSLP